MWSAEQRGQRATAGVVVVVRREREKVVGVHALDRVMLRAGVVAPRVLWWGITPKYGKANPIIRGGPFKPIAIANVVGQV